MHEGQIWHLLKSAPRKEELATWTELQATPALLRLMLDLIHWQAALVLSRNTAEILGELDI